MLLVSIFAFLYPLFKYGHALQNISPFNIFPIEHLSIFNPYPANVENRVRY